MKTKWIWASLMAASFSVGLIASPTAAATDDLCVGADAHTRDITKPLVWTSSHNGATIYNAFTPTQESSGNDWDGIREYAGICGIIQEIQDCLADGNPLAECFPE